MPKTLQFRRYPTDTLKTTVGADGELIIDSSKKSVTVHDGSTQGGNLLQNAIAKSSNAMHVYRQPNWIFNEDGTVTGAIQLKITGLYSVDLSGLMKVVITQNDATDGTFPDYELTIGGNWRTSDHAWHNTEVNVQSTSSSSLNVRFATNGLDVFIVIGDTTTSWKYPRVIVSEVVTNAVVSGYSPDFVISRIVTLPSTVNNTIEASVAKNILNQIKTVDGTGSGLDADMVDGVHLGASGGQTNYIPYVDSNKSIQRSTYSSEREFICTPVNGTANQKWDLILPQLRYHGTIELEIVGGWNNANLTGKILKSYHLVTTNGTTNLASQVDNTYTFGSINSIVRVSDIINDGSNNKIVISYNSTSASNFIVRVRSVSGLGTNPEVAALITLSAVYTTDSTVYPVEEFTVTTSGSERLRVNANGNVGIGASPISVNDGAGRLTISGSTASQLFLEDTSRTATGDDLAHVSYDDGLLLLGSAARSGSTTTNRINRIAMTSNALGIASTPKAYRGGYTALDLGNNNLFSAPWGTYLSLCVNAYDGNYGGTVGAHCSRFNSNGYASKLQVGGQTEQYLSFDISRVSGTTGPVTAITSGRYYLVVALGSTTLAQWQACFSGVSAIPVVGDALLATATTTLAGGATVEESVSWNNLMYVNAQGTMSVNAGIDVGNSANSSNTVLDWYEEGTASLTASGFGTLATTAITCSGTTATATFAAQTYAPFVAGQRIVVAGATPTTYNGTWVVTACTLTTVSFTVTTSGIATATVPGTLGVSTNACDITFTRIGNTVTLSFPNFRGISNSTSFTLSSLPIQIRPTLNNINVPCRFVDNNALSSNVGNISIANTGVLTLYSTFNGAGFTGSGVKGLATLSVSYTLS